MEKGEIFGTWNDDLHNIINVVIMAKHDGTDNVTVCPISVGNIPYDYTLDINGKMMRFNTKQLYTLKKSDLGSKVGKINEDNFTELLNVCLNSMCLDKI